MSAPEELRARLDVLDKEIAAYPSWGAALAAMDEERREIRRALNRADAWKGGLAYLATPYTKFGCGIDAAFIAAAKLTALLLRAGVKCYSPIAHTHPVAVYGNLDPLDHSIWLPFDQAMMKAADVLIVAHMDGWQESDGIAEEVKFFEAAGKPIFDLDPKTLRMERRRVLVYEPLPALSHAPTRGEGG